MCNIKGWVSSLVLILAIVPSVASVLLMCEAKSVAKFVVKNLPAIVSLGVGLLTGGVLLPAILPALGLAAGGLVGAVLSGATVGFLTSFTGALIMGADLGTALSMGLMSAAVAGITAGLTTAVGDIFGHVTRYVGAKANAIQKALAHGVVQGISNELRGGKFKHGFFSGAFTTLAAPLVKGLFDSPLNGPWPPPPSAEPPRSWAAANSPTVP